jgi:hypothetical protein
MTASAFKSPLFNVLLLTGCARSGGDGQGYKDTRRGARRRKVLSRGGATPADALENFLEPLPAALACATPIIAGGRPELLQPGLRARHGMANLTRTRSVCRPWYRIRLSLRRAVISATINDLHRLDAAPRVGADYRSRATKT